MNLCNKIIKRNVKQEVKASCIVNLLMINVGIISHFIEIMNQNNENCDFLKLKGNFN